MLLKFTSLGRDAIFKNHYELSDIFPDYTSEDWRDFLLEPDVQAYIFSEQRLMLQVEQRKIAKDASDSKSVGQAQMITALDKMTQQIEEQKSGPICIYSYIDLTPEQKEFSIIDYHRYKLVEMQPEEELEEIKQETSEVELLRAEHEKLLKKLNELNEQINDKTIELEKLQAEIEVVGDDMFDD